MQMSQLLSATNIVDSQESLKQQVVAAILSSGGGESVEKRKRTPSEAELASGLSNSEEPVQTRLVDEEEDEEDQVSARQRQSADTLTTTPPHSPHSSYLCDSDNDFMTISSSSFVDHQPPKKPRQQKQPTAAVAAATQKLLKVDIGQKGGEKVIDCEVDCASIADKTLLGENMIGVENQHVGDDTLASMMQTPPQSAIIITPNSIATGLSAVDSPQSDASHHHQPPSVVKSEFDFLEEALHRLENDYDESRNQQATIRKQIKTSFGRLRQTQANYFEIYLREQIEHNKRENDTSSSDVNSLLVDLNYEVQKSKDDDGLCVKSRYLDDLTDDEDEQEEKLVQEVVDSSLSRLTESCNKSDLFWNVQRVQLGSEWQRIQTKLSLLKQQNDELTENKENNQIETAMRIQQLTESLKESVLSSARTEIKPLQPARQVAGFESNEKRISKCIMTTAAHFKQNVLKTSCLCDEPEESEAVPLQHNHQEVRSRRILTRGARRTCICCHPFKTSEETSIKNRPDALADHTYCKELKFVRRLDAKESVRENSKLADDLSLSPKSENNESKSLDESSPIDLAKANRLSEESLIDAGVELSLQDIKLIPDLTYDELKFLCDEENIDQDLTASRPRLASSFSVASGRVQADSYLSQSTPQLYTPLIYSPSVTVTTTTDDKALSELRKRRQTARRSVNPTSTTTTPLKDSNTRSRSGSRKTQLKNILFNKQAAITQSAKEKRKLSGTLDNSVVNKKPRVDLSPLSLSGKQRKSARSNSTMSNESATPAPLSATRSPSSAFHFNKFDIDNIVLPPEMIISNYKLDPKFIEHSVVPTPRWRVQEINSFPEFELEIEDLDDETFWKRHETAELKERYFMVYKRMERHQHHTQSDKTATTGGSIKLNREAFEREHNLDTLTLFELRGRVLQLESNEKNQRKRQLSSTSSSSLSNSMSTVEMKNSMNGSQLTRTTSNSLLSSSLPQSSLKSILSNKQPPVIPAKPHAHMSINSSNRSSGNTIVGPTGLVVTQQQQQRWTARKFPLTDVEMNELNSTQ